MCRWAENYSTHFWVSSVKGSHTRCKAVKTELANMNVRELQQETIKIIWTSIAILSLLMTVYLSIWSGRRIIQTFSLLNIYEDG